MYILRFLPYLLAAACMAGQHDFDSRILEKYGRDAVDCIAEADTVYSYRIGHGCEYDILGRLKNRSPFGYIDRFPVEESAPILTPDQVAKLKSAILNASNFRFKNKTCRCCYFEPDYAFVFLDGRESVSVLLSKRCLQLNVRYGDRSSGMTPKAKARDLWSLVSTVFQATEDASGVALSPPSPSKVPRTYVEPQPIQGPSVFDLEVGDMLEIEIQYGSNGQVHDFRLERTSRGHVLHSGTRLSSELGAELHRSLGTDELDLIHEFIKNCRWKKTAYSSIRYTLELAWYRNGTPGHLEKHLWDRARNSGLPDIRILSEIVLEWREQ